MSTNIHSNRNSRRFSGTKATNSNFIKSKFRGNDCLLLFAFSFVMFVFDYFMLVSLATVGNINTKWVWLCTVLNGSTHVLFYLCFCLLATRNVSFWFLRDARLQTKTISILCTRVCLFVCFLRCKRDTAQFLQTTCF